MLVEWPGFGYKLRVHIDHNGRISDLTTASKSLTTTNNFWILSVCSWLVFMQVTGGTSATQPGLVAAHFVLSAALLGVAVFRLHAAFPSCFALAAWCVLVILYIIAFLQMLPLPPAQWTALPGREVLTGIASLGGQELPWLPISLSPAATGASLVSFLPAIAGFTAILTLKRADMLNLSLAVLLCAILAVGIGLLQKAGQWPEKIPLFAPSVNGTASGTFSNRNFYAAQMFASIPFLAVFAAAVQERFRVKGIVLLTFIIIYMGLMIVGLALAGSRGGVLLAMPSAVLTLLFVHRQNRGVMNLRGGGIATFAIIGTLLVVSQVSMIGILRLLKTDPLQDFRAVISEVSISAAKAFWPTGSGFGTFVTAYQLHEKPDAIVDDFVNAAHNDWLQLFLEGGALGAAAIAAFFLFAIVGLVRMLKFNRASDSYAAAVRAGLLVLMLLSLHALVDFGLRTPALMTLFAASAGLVALAGRYEAGIWRAPQPLDIDRDRQPIRRRDTGKPHLRPYARPR